MEIKGIIFDYGGTLDSFGDHWSEVIYEGFLNTGAILTKEDFRKGYIYAERLLNSERKVFPGDNFLQLMRIKVTHEVDYLYREGYLDEYVHSRIQEHYKSQNKSSELDINQSSNREQNPNKPPEETILSELIETVAQYCYAHARKSIASAKPVLEQLHNLYPKVLVSNFYGNIESVLLDMGIRHIFQGIIESSNVGVRKPDPRIFSLGITVLNMEPKDVVVIGDSYAKDIQPAISLGCQTIWLKGRQWSKEEEENSGKDTIVIRTLDEIIPMLIQ